jgi:DNA invertase Pin-like site-specific DNA recombinase
MPRHSTTAFSYVRFSSKRQEQGDSHRRQTDGRAAAYCQRRGWTLSPQTYEDLGVSAFKGANALVGNLGEFLKAVRSGRIAPGSVLIVESLDRISRQGIDEGYDLIKTLLKADILIVTLSPEREFNKEATRSLSKGALEIQLILERAAEESERKSERIAAARKQERKRLRDKKEVVTHMLPAWIAEEGGKTVLIPDRAAVVKRLYELAAAGYGTRAIVARMTRDGVPPIGKKTTWCRSYVVKLLRDKRVLGQHQPTCGGQRDGEPVEGFYPPAVSLEEWRAARAGMQQRRRFQGRVGKSQVNIFAGLMVHARDGDPYQMTSRRSHSSSGKEITARVLINSAGVQCQARAYSIPYDPFERAVLSCLNEIDPRELLGEPVTEANGAAELEKELAGVQAELADAQTFMRAHGFSPTIGRRITELEAREKELQGELENISLEEAHPLGNSWSEVQDLAAALDAAPDPEEARLRLRAALRRITETISLLIVCRGHERLCAVQFHFREGGRRDYLIRFRPERSLFGKKTVPAICSAWSLARAVAAPDDLNFQRPEDIAALEQLLGEVDLASLVE